MSCMERDTLDGVQAEVNTDLKLQASGLTYQAKLELGCDASFKNAILQWKHVQQMHGKRMQAWRDTHTRML